MVIRIVVAKGMAMSMPNIPAVSAPIKIINKIATGCISADLENN